MPIGSRDFTSEQNVNGNNIGIERRVSLHPLRWRARCQACLTTFTVDHERVPYAKCPMNCGNRSANKPTPTARAGTDIREESIRSSQSAESAAFRRQEAETGEDNINIRGKRNVRLSAHRGLDEGFFQSQGFSNDRARNEYREFKENYDREQEAPQIAAKSAYESTVTALARERKKAVATGIDSEFYITPDEADNIAAANELSLGGSDEALGFLNQAVIEKFRVFGSHHDFVNSPKNLDALTAYCERNLHAHGIKSVVYVPFEILVRAFARLRLYSLLEEPTHVYIDPEPDKENYFESEQRRQREEEQRQAEEATRRGVDPQTGVERIYSTREVRLMSAGQFKRCFFSKIAPTFRDLFIALSENRTGAQT